MGGSKYFDSFRNGHKQKPPEIHRGGFLIGTINNFNRQAYHKIHATSMPFLFFKNLVSVFCCIEYNQRANHINVIQQGSAKNSLQVSTWRINYFASLSKGLSMYFQEAVRTRKTFIRTGAIL